ncbi:MAG TPA: hypothetical protein PK437_07505 [Thiobacillaceae bacterium]|nr:hypothetical protein [Thiobacillaceae bacterium]HNH90675.1 hypothetical protein [Thiobacillaceae bacterium]HNI08717.1 hypothetical protein [Thiobacillaceae bacterium]
MTTYLVTIGLILAILLFGIAVQRAYERFAQRHPELGPFRETGKGCGSCSAGSGCSGGSCDSSTAER